MAERIVVVGLGYVGLPVAVALAEKFDVVGFDISEARISALSDGVDRTNEVEPEKLASANLSFSSDPAVLAGRSMYIVTVPTPIDDQRRPDLAPLESSCRLIGPHLRPGAIVVFESTVYPGLTEDFCGPLLEECSGLRCGRDFHLGYSPERINPGDKVRRLESIRKIISAQDEASLARLREIYGAIIKAGLHEAPTIRVAEAAKVIENTQRDINIALMNEIALIFDRMGINTADVLEAAQTKWNFLPFTPGLVGGHCIGVDPYYLTAAAERFGYRPEVILAGRRINDSMGAVIARKVVKLLAAQGAPIPGAKVAILGLTFKEDVPDLRNSKVPDIIAELRDFGIEPLVIDPHASPEDALAVYGIELSDLRDCFDLDGLLLAVAHAEFAGFDEDWFARRFKGKGVVVDVKSLFRSVRFPENITYWSL